MLILQNKRSYLFFASSIKKISLHVRTNNVSDGTSPIIPTHILSGERIKDIFRQFSTSFTYLITLNCIHAVKWVFCISKCLINNIWAGKWCRRKAFQLFYVFIYVPYTYETARHKRERKGEVNFFMQKYWSFKYYLTRDSK